MANNAILFCPQVSFQTILNLCFSSGEDGKAVVALIDRLLLRSFQRGFKGPKMYKMEGSRASRNLTVQRQVKKVRAFPYNIYPVSAY